MTKITVDIKLCDGCSKCVEACPTNAIIVRDTKARIDTDKCVMCGACVDTCPKTAIAIKKETVETKKTPKSYGIWIFCEIHDGNMHASAFELLGEGRRIANIRGKNLCAIMMGNGISHNADIAIRYGADEVHIIDLPEYAHFLEDMYANALSSLAKKYKPEIILSAATNMGRSFIPRVAAELRTGLTADCTSLDIDENGNLLQTRPAFGGNIMATIVCESRRPQMATIRPKVLKSAKPDSKRTGKIINEYPNPFESAIKFIRSSCVSSSTPSIADADIIVTGGVGLKGPENFKLIFELAKVLGAAVGATRSVIDRGWLPYEHQIGQTGKTVCPKLYIAVGVSGAIQHIVGMQSSHKIIAINQDPNANIFKVTDIGIAGDLFDIVPKLTAALKTH